MKARPRQYQAALCTGSSWAAFMSSSIDLAKALRFSSSLQIVLSAKSLGFSIESSGMDLNSARSGVTIRLVLLGVVSGSELGRLEASLLDEKWSQPS